MATRRQLPVPVKPGTVARSKQQALMTLSSDLPELPKDLDKEKQYRVKMLHTVTLPNGHALRPSDDVVLSGEYAASLREHIGGAKAI